MAALTPDPGKHESRNSSVQTLLKVEKLTQIAFVLPVSALVGWLLGAALDKWRHTHWIALTGLIVGVIAGFVQLFRMVAEPGNLAATAVDHKAPKGPGFDDRDEAGR